MREILFKAKRIDNGEWVEGYLFDNGFDGEEKKYFIGGLIIEKYNGTACDEWDITGIDFCEIDPETLCQFTGLCDKNGKRIWENDILMAHLDEFYPEDVTYETVEWGVAGWAAHETSNIDREYGNVDREYLDEFDLKNFEVVGNIFDNKELLQEESDE